MEPFDKAMTDGDVTQIQVKHKDVACLLKGEKTEGEFEYTWEYYTEDLKCYTNVVTRVANKI